MGIGSDAAWEHVWRESNAERGMTPDVLVVIPTIPGREELLERAMMSIRDEEVSFVVGVNVDRQGHGPAEGRNFIAASSAPTTWVAFLDDDDEFKPAHLTKLVRNAEAIGADVVYPWFDIDRIGHIRNDLDPLKMHGRPAFGQAFDPAALDDNNFIPVTALVRRDLFRQVGGFPVPRTDEWPHEDCEDWGLWLRLRDAGATFSHLPERTWTWHWHSRNTSGMPDRARKIYGGKP